MKVPNMLKQFYAAIPIKFLTMLGFCITSQAQFNQCTNRSTILHKNKTISVGSVDVSNVRNMSVDEYTKKLGGVSDIELFPEIGLHVVVDSADTKKLEVLLSSSALKDTSIDVRDENGNTPLMRALKANRQPMAQKLIEYACTKQKRTNLMICNDNKEYPLTLAIDKKNQDGAKLLIKNLTADDLKHIINFSTAHPLSLAMSYNLTTVAEAMIDKLAPDAFVYASDKEKKEQGTPLHVAVTTGNKKALLKMIGKLTDVQRMTSAGKRAASPLHLAIEKNNGTAEVLIFNLDPISFKQTDSKNRTPLHRAAACNATKLFEDMWKKVEGKYHDPVEIQSYLTAKDNEQRTLFARAYLQTKRSQRQLSLIPMYGNKTQDYTFRFILGLTKANINEAITQQIIDEIDREFPRKDPTKPGEDFNRSTKRNHCLKEIMRERNLTIPEDAFAKKIPLPSA